MLFLPAEPFTILDLQTSAPTPSHGDIIEVGWQQWDGQRLCEAEHFLVSVPEQAIAKRIQRITGLGTAELANGIPLEAAIEKLRNLLKQDTWFVIFFEQFERSFLSKYLPEQNYSSLCLFKFAKHLFPHLPSHSLKAVAAHCNVSLPASKRTELHVAASLQVLSQLYGDFTQQHGARSFADLSIWMQNHKPEKVAKNFRGFGFEPPDLPNQPGVYQMFDQSDQLLYIGKATSLKNRVKSYFTGKKTKGSRLNEMICRVRSLRWIPLPTPQHAALVEAILIKTLKPSYNIALRTDELDNSAPIYVDTLLKTKANEAAPGLWGPFFDVETIDFLSGLSALYDGDTREGSNVYWQLTIDWQILDAVFKELKDELQVPAGKSFWYFCLLCLKLEQEAKSDEEETESLSDQEAIEEIKASSEEEPLEVQMSTLIQRACANFAKRILEMRICRFLYNCDIEFLDTKKETQRFRVRHGKVEWEDLATDLSINQELQNPKNDWDLLRVILSVVKQLYHIQSSQVIIRSGSWNFDQARLLKGLKY